MYLYQKLSISNKFRFLLKLLKIIIKLYPKPNSTLARPSIKKLNVIKFRSSIIAADIIVEQYSIVQVISENKIKKRKLDGFIRKLVIDIQNKKIQKFSQLCKK